MNDQRQVIFSQRLKVLKDSNISEIIKDFFNEELKRLESFKNDYQKSNDAKYLTQIKSLIGNSINDDELAKIVARDNSDFNKFLKDIFSKKRRSRVAMLGDDQNSILEKKIFLQIIDFSWRSHLQYLEQLRQVIGLRQYGQKDPLSEFKKEAFVLFEGLLAKIKSDVVKLLLNLNVIMSDESKKEEKTFKNISQDLKKVGRNEKCPCGSGKKFKHCHGNI